jgi:zinc transport system permease protein
MAAVTFRMKHRADTVIGVIWATGMATGIVLMDLTPGYNVDLMSYLFGSILAVPKTDLLQMLIASGVILFLLLYFYRGFLAMSYDEEFARLRGVPVVLLYFLLIGMVAVSVVITIRVVGLILVIALLTIPPFIAEKYARSLGLMMVLSGALSAVFTFSGLWLSYSANLTSGAAIILVAAACFFAVIGIEWLRTQTRKPGRGGPGAESAG